MHAHIVSPLEDTAAGAIAEEVLRACVHCGLCNAACPTFALTADELDGPRGRIYLMKKALEGEAVGALTQHHLDRCLGCRACETACPSGVEYHRLFDIGRALVEEKTPRRHSRLRSALRYAAARPELFGVLIGLGRAFKPLLPKALAEHLPVSAPAGPWPKARHSRRMMILQGCVQHATAKRFNAATARVFDHLGVSLVEQNGCCGATSAHLGSPVPAKAHARRQIDAWAKALSSGCEAVVVNASGCAAFVRDWPDLFADEPAYSDKARRVVAALRDPLQIVREGGLKVQGVPKTPRIAVHDPCTLRNGPGLGGEVERLLAGLGYDPQPVANPGQCCGSAGAYSLFQPDIAGRLREERLAALSAGAPEAIYTANIGCWLHLAATSPTPVRHWIEAVDDLLAEGALARPSDEHADSASSISPDLAAAPPLAAAAAESSRPSGKAKSRAQAAAKRAAADPRPALERSATKPTATGEGRGGITAKGAAKAAKTPPADRAKPVRPAPPARAKSTGEQTTKPAATSPSTVRATTKAETTTKPMPTKPSTVRATTKAEKTAKPPTGAPAIAAERPRKARSTLAKAAKPTGGGRGRPK